MSSFLLVAPNPFTQRFASVGDDEELSFPLTVFKYVEIPLIRLPPPPPPSPPLSAVSTSSTSSSFSLSLSQQYLSTARLTFLASLPPQAALKISRNLQLYSQPHLPDLDGILSAKPRIFQGFQERRKADKLTELSLRWTLVEQVEARYNLASEQKQRSLKKAPRRRYSLTSSRLCFQTTFTETFSEISLFSEHIL